MQVLTIIRLETLVCGHRAGFRFYRRRKSRPQRGRPQIDAELRESAHESRRAARVWGHAVKRRQVHGQTVGPPIQGWRTFLRDRAPDEVPPYLIRDRDRIYGTVVTCQLRAMGIRDQSVAPAPPWQNGFFEQLIASIRRECVDHIIVLGEARTCVEF